jgi:hypothetical protein
MPAVKADARVQQSARVRARGCAATGQLGNLTLRNKIRIKINDRPQDVLVFSAHPMNTSEFSFLQEGNHLKVLRFLEANTRLNQRELADAQGG